MTQTSTPKSLARNGVTLRYVESGAGDPPILFVHGWTCSRESWPGQIPHFEQKHRDGDQHGAAQPLATLPLQPRQDAPSPGVLDGRDLHRSGASSNVLRLQHDAKGMEHGDLLGLYRQPLRR